MKRRTKLFLFLIGILALGGIGVLLDKIQHNAGMPFPGAVVVLDDASWRSRSLKFGADTGYLWTNQKTIIYINEGSGNDYLMEQPLFTGDKAASPKILPIAIKREHYLQSVSPNGKLLMLREENGQQIASYTIACTDGRGIPVVFADQYDDYLWSQDSKFLYSTPYSAPQSLLKRTDVQTGESVTTEFFPTTLFTLDSVTPEGKLLHIDYDTFEQSGITFWKWTIEEIRDKSVVKTMYQQGLNFPNGLPTLSPDGKRLLWNVDEEKVTLLQRFEQKFFSKTIQPQRIIRWWVTDVAGNNLKTIGITPEYETGYRELHPEWTPDSKGVHFVQDGKLMYLAVP